MYQRNCKCLIRVIIVVLAPEPLTQIVKLSVCLGISVS